MISLFRTEPRINHLLPASFENARLLATKILRSPVQMNLLCGLWEGQNRAHHINIDDLTLLLNKDEVFVIDKIRLHSFIDCRACTQCEVNPAKIYLNSQLLLEMQDREYEQQQIESMHRSDWSDLLCKQPAFKQNGPGPVIGTLGVYNNNLQFNSFEQACQGDERTEKVQVAPFRSSERQTKRPAESEVPECPPKQAKLEKPLPSAMSVTQKNVLMLTILLVREAQHLIMYALSDALTSDGETPRKKFLPDDSAYFTDVGHFMERAMYGYSISHASNHDYITAFGIEEVLGSLLQHASLRYILQPCPAFLALLDNPLLDVNITADTLKLCPTSTVEYVAPASLKRSKSAEFNPNSQFSSDDENEDGSEDDDIMLHNNKGKA